MGKMRNPHKILVENREGRSPLGRPSRKWKDNIKIDLGETGWEDVDWIHLAQDTDQ
jgi:hypothetical protein